MNDDLVELTRKHLEEEPDEEMDLLNEITLDEGFLKLSLITGFLVKTKQFGSQIDREVGNLKGSISFNDFPLPQMTFISAFKSSEHFFQP